MGLELPVPAGEPGLLQSVGTFVSAVVRHAVGGFRTVDDAVYEARLAICEPCPARTEEWHCRECGCVLKGETVSKARWAHEECPRDKWPTIS